MIHPLVLLKLKVIRGIISGKTQVGLNEYLKILTRNPDISEINGVKVDVVVDKTNVIRTCIGESNEGQFLSGYKLIVHGTIKQIIEYTTSGYSKTIHCIEHQSKFSTFIVLPREFSEGSKINIEAIVDNVYYSLANPRCIFESIELLILAKVKS